MENPNRFYTYAYLREDGSPYYIGKGTGKRIYKKSGKPCGVPKDKSRVIFLKKNLTEEQAFKHEIYMITIFGRKDIKTGILRNKTGGGEGISGYVHTKETKEKISKLHKGRKLTPEQKEKLLNSHKGKPNSPEHNKLISKALKGIIRSPETREKIRKCKLGENHPMSNWWRLTFLDGSEIILCGLTNWAKENGYYAANIHHLYTQKIKRYKDIIKVEKIHKI